eukprot:403358482
MDFERYQEFSSLLHAHFSSRDNAERKNVEAQIKQLKIRDELKFLQACVAELIDTSNDPQAIQLASILFKNTLISKDDINAHLWERQDPQKRAFIKEKLFEIISANVHPQFSKSGATCIAAIAQIEIPTRSWPELLPLLSQMAFQDNPPAVRFGSLQAIGFICEDVDPEYFTKDELNNIFGVLLQNVDTVNIELTQITMKAFARAAYLTKSCFESDPHRHYVMNQLFLAGSINDEEIQSSSMEALNDIARESYDFMREYIPKIGELTSNLLQSEYEQGAKLAIEVWATIAEVEAKREQQNEAHSSIIRDYSSQIIGIVLTALAKQDIDSMDEQSDELPQQNSSYNAASAIEAMARILKDDILDPVFDFIKDRFASDIWVNRFVSMLAFASIIEGPSTDRIIQVVSVAYTNIMSMIDDSALLVRIMMGSVYQKIATVVPQIILEIPENLDLFTSKVQNHLVDNFKVALAMIASLRNLFNSANLIGKSELLNSALNNTLPVIYRMIFQQEVIVQNELQSVADSIIDIIDDCDFQSNAGFLWDLQTNILDELNKTLTPETCSVNLLGERLEHFQNMLGSIIDQLIYKFKHNLNGDFVQNVLNLVISIFNQHQKVTSGGCVMIHGLMVGSEKNFLPFVNQVKQYIISGMLQTQDPWISTVSCGLISDFAANLELDFSQFAEEFMRPLFILLQGSEYNLESKSKGLIAVGDTCLAIDQNFIPFYEKTLECIMAAATQSFEPIFENQTQLIELQSSILDCFNSLLHGMEPATQNQNMRAKNHDLSKRVLFFMDTYIDKAPHIHDEQQKLIYDMYTDILSMYGQDMQEFFVRLPLTRKLLENVDRVKFDDKQDTVERFYQFINQFQIAV